jgi:PKD repeat protein
MLFKPSVLFFILIFSISPFSYSQKNNTGELCNFSSVHQHKLKTDSVYGRRVKENNTFSYHFQLARKTNFRTGSLSKITSSIYTIPVVVHVVHNNGAENISDQQILDGIDHLNKAFAALPPYDGQGSSDMDIRFCLAVRDPAGNFTSGINRIVSTLTNVDVATQDQALKNLSIWDPTQYINIWLVNEICSDGTCAMAGYAYLASAHGLSFDGIVNEARFFGSSADDSKVHIHEAGHYFNLYHTFESGCPNSNCLLNGDKVCDTPPDNSTTPVFPCGSFTNTCHSDIDDPSTNNPFRPVASGGLGDQNDQFHNFMDYGYQDCQNLFTPGQGDRMLAALLGPRASLLQSKGCETPCTSPITIGFTASSSTIQVGASVSFTNSTSGASQYDWKINGSSVSSALNFSHTFNTKGTYIITLTASNSDLACTQKHYDTIQVTCPVQAAFTASATHIDPGQSITFTNISSGASSYQWLLDNSPAGSSTDLTYLFSQPGNYAVGLIAENGTCTDTSAFISIVVKKCNSPVREKIWYFGYWCGLDFSSGTPVGTPNWQFSTIEGNGMAFDDNGDLLFYSDGRTILDKNHNVMANGNGLMGGAFGSSTQECLIIPYPGFTDKFIIFTSDEYEDSCALGYRYSIVDMNLNGGLGAVTSQKNILLYAPNSEKLTATYHANGKDIWVMTHEYNTNNFAAYLVTANGVSSSAVISSFGAIGNYWPVGSINFSHSGKKLANAACQVNRIEIFDFNNTTGILSNYISIPLTSTHFPYGIEFSPDDSRLYISAWGNPTTLFQINMNAGSSTDIINSLTSISTYNNMGAGLGGMQLGPDDKIYVSGFIAKISVINNPNELGSACNFTPESLDLGGGSPLLGIPNIFEKPAQGMLEIVGQDTVCSALKNVQYIISNKDSLSFSAFSKGNSIISIVNDTLISVDFLGAGNDTLIVVDSSCVNNPVTATFPVLVLPSPAVNLGNDTVFCNSAISKVLDAGNGFKSYLWQDSSTNQIFSVNDSGSYWVNVTDYNDCSNADTIELKQYYYYLDIKDTTICHGDIVVLDPGNQFDSYSWQDKSTNQTYTAFLPGKYWVKVPSMCGTLTDTAEVTVKPLPLVTFEGLKYLYCISDTPSVLKGTPPGGIFGGAVTSVNIFNPEIAGVGEHIIHYYFLDSSGCAQSNYQKTQVKDSCTFNIPNLITANNDNLNDYFSIPGLPPGFTLEIFNRWSERIYIKENYDNSWSGKDLSDGIYFYRLYNNESTFQGWIHLVK